MFELDSGKHSTYSNVDYWKCTTSKGHHALASTLVLASSGISSGALAPPEVLPSIRRSSGTTSTSSRTLSGALALSGTSSGALTSGGTSLGLTSIFH